MSKFNFLTLFDINYSLKGIAMLDSFLSKHKEYQVYVLCLDEETEQLINEYFNHVFHNRIVLHKLQDLDKSLINYCKGTRSHQEFCWTLASIYSNFILESFCQPTIYLDADIYFFSSAEVILRNQENFSVAATPHRFSPRLSYLIVNGIFNVQWVYFANDGEGKQASRDWMNDCVDDCSYDPPTGRVGDQKYLDKWPTKYKNFYSIDHIGMGLAPWNFEQYSIIQKGDNFFVDNTELIFYHFHQFSINNLGRITLASPMYSAITRVNQEIYSVYINHLKNIQDQLNILKVAPASEYWHVAEYSKLMLRLSQFVSTTLRRKQLWAGRGSNPEPTD